MLLSHECPCYNCLPWELFQAIWLAEMPKSLLAATNNCLKRDKKHRLLKHKALEVHFPMAVSQNIDVNNIKYQGYTITLSKVRSTLLMGVLN